MRDGQSSRTAAYVALLRALGDRGLTSAEGFRDPTARALLPPRWVDAFESLASKIPTLPPRVRERIIARIDPLVVRTLAIDAELTSALAAGCPQVVILGAGLDGRAYRITALNAARVFEVDHPATQSLKRRLALNLPRRCGDLTYVSCDFAREILAERLQSAGHRATEPTAWICEGVTLYLTDDAIRAMLATLGERSAANSTLILEYHDSEAPTSDPYFSIARKILLALWSEPQIGLRTQSRMRADLEGAGLRVAKDFGVLEWGAAFAHSTPRPRQRRARIAVAKS